MAQATRLDGILLRRAIKKRVIASQFPPLLREYADYRGAVSGGCPDEPQFREMYEVLGNAQAQEDIRLEHPEVEHCTKLQINPRACNGCALNPMKAEKLAKRERVEDGMPLIQASFDLEEHSRLGLLSLDSINSMDMILLTTQRQHQEFNRDERLAILIANKMAEVLSKMFGGK